jgi:Nucleotidyltransferase domain
MDVPQGIGRIAFVLIFLDYGRTRLRQWAATLEIAKSFHRPCPSRLAAAAPASRVILYGSQARGTASERSDVDILVIEPQVDNPRTTASARAEGLGCRRRAR